MGVPCSEYEIPEAPVETEVAISVVVVVGVIVEVQFAAIVGEERVDTGQEADGRDEKRVHWVNECAEEVTHRALQDGLKGMYSVLGKGSRLHKLMMMPVDMLHKPVDMEQVMREVEPTVEDEEVNEDLLHQLQQSKLILFTGPVPVVRCQRIHLPQPDGGI